MGPDRLFPGDGVSEAGSRDAWTTMGKAPAFKLGESRTFLTEGSILSQATNCPLCYVTVLSVKGCIKNCEIFDWSNVWPVQHKLSLLGFDKHYLFCFVNLCPSLNPQPPSCKRPTSQTTSYLLTLFHPQGTQSTPLFLIFYKSFKTKKKLFSENAWNLNRFSSWKYNWVFAEAAHYICQERAVTQKLALCFTCMHACRYSSSPTAIKCASFLATDANKLLQKKEGWMKRADM